MKEQRENGEFFSEHDDNTDSNVEDDAEDDVPNVNINTEKRNESNQHKCAFVPRINKVATTIMSRSEALMTLHVVVVSDVDEVRTIHKMLDRKCYLDK